MNNCTECDYSLIINDPDPYDWFCDDDKALLCTRVGKETDKNSLHASKKYPYKEVTMGCRPYNLKKETEVPNWCPLKEV